MSALREWGEASPLGRTAPPNLGGIVFWAEHRRVGAPGPEAEEMTPQVRDRVGSSSGGVGALGRNRSFDPDQEFQHVRLSRNHYS
jgi:hypothetical protein